MGKKKTSTTQTVNHQWKDQPANQYYNNAAQHLNSIDLQSGVRNAFGQNENLINESGNEFFGANQSAEQRDRIKFGRKFNNNILKGKALGQAVQDENSAKITGNMALGGATAPVLVNSGGTSTTVQPFDWGGLIASGLGAGASVASAGMAPGASM